jgi:hypothetical protein
MFIALHDKLESMHKTLLPEQKAEIREYLNTFAADNQEQERNIQELISLVL